MNDMIWAIPAVAALMIFPQVKYSLRMDTKLDPLAADRAFFAALISANLDSLDSLLVEDFILIDVLSGAEITKFGRPGHQLGEFTHCHTLDVDSKGNLYIAETDIGRRVQKFRLVK